MQKTDYQPEFSKINTSVLDFKIRSQKARKIVAVIKDFEKIRKKELANLICLDIGGSAGFAAKSIAPLVKKVYVTDIDEKALKFGEKHNAGKNIYYKVDDAMNMVFKDKSIDVIICNQVYEHVPSHRKLMKEIYRVLKDDGICYFGGSNKFRIIEQHYRLPFLSWLPKPIAHKYINSFRGIKIYYETHLSYFGLKKLFKDFYIHDYTIKVIKKSDKFFATDNVKNNSLLSLVPEKIMNFLLPIIPGYIFILSKK